MLCRPGVSFGRFQLRRSVRSGPRLPGGPFRLPQPSRPAGQAVVFFISLPPELISVLCQSSFLWPSRKRANQQPSPENSVTYDRSSVEAVVNHYFDALYEGDADKLGAVFHPSADLRWVDKGELQVLTVPDWLDRVRKRPSAKAEGKAREDFIVTVDRSDEIHRVRQGALPITAALLHRLSGGDETHRRLADRFQFRSPLRFTRVSTGPAGYPGRGSHLPDLSRFCVRRWPAPRCWPAESMSHPPSCYCWQASVSPSCLECRR